MQWLHDSCTGWHKSTVEVDEADKLTELAMRSRLWERTNSFNVSLDRSDAVSIHVVAEEV